MMQRWRLRWGTGLLACKAALAILLIVPLDAGPRRSAPAPPGRGGRAGSGRHGARKGTSSWTTSSLQEGDILLMGGRAGNLYCPQNTALFLKLRSRSYVAAPQLRICRAGAEAAVLGDKVYLVGGFDFDVLSAVDALSFAPYHMPLNTDTSIEAGWQSVSGNTTEAILTPSSMLRLKPATAWTEMPRLKKARTRFGMCALHGLLWVFGGADANGEVMSSVEVFNPEANVWMQTAEPMPTARQGHGVTVLDGQIFVIGGVDDEGLPLNIVEVYNPATGTWHDEQRMQQQRERFGISVVGSCIFVAGGFSEEGRPIADVEVFDASLPSGYCLE